MKTMYIISIFLILIGLGCDNNSKKGNDENDLIGIWELIQIEEQDENNNWTQIKSPEGLGWGCLINLEFKNNGWFDGHTCINRFSGSYEVYESDDRINIKNDVGTKSYSGTEAGDRGWTLKYWDYLIKLESYSILSDTLTISGGKFRIIYKLSNQ